MKKFFLFTLFYLEALTILAQTDSIRGRVFNSSGEPLQAATIVLQSQSDSSFLGGVLSDVSGRFVLPAQNVPTKVIVSCLGYTTSVMKVPQNKNIDVVLTEKEQLLGEVVVKGHAPTVKMTSDGFSTRVQNTVLAKAGTAADVLGQIPMLKKTSDGYEVFGKGTPVFYLNGHRVYDVSELENLKSKNLKTVELVLNPGVKYDASTKAVINLTTVQNSDEGWGVDVESNYIQNHHASFTDKVNLSYQTKRFSFYDLIKYDRNNNITWKDLRQDVYVDTLWNHNNSEKEHRYSRKIENTMGIDYQLAANSHIGAKYLIRWSLQDKMRMTNLNNVLANGEYYDQLITNGAEQNHYHPYHQLNVYYSGLISGYTVNADMDYLRSQSATDDDYEEL
ncbi:MAG: carboxypeptidase-like regulatory domain-containing protein, partial [Prevotella sp.]|nr:carboxypeptidase-like regulatory domain-containing protein [Prevotella sp.]